MGGGVHRLHARVLEVGHLVGGLERLAAGGQRRGGVAVVPRHETGLAGRGRVLLRDPRGGELVERALVPLDLESLPALERDPEAVGDHGDAVGHLDDVPDPGDRLGRGRVERLHLAAGHDRAPLDRSDQQAGQAHVDPVDGLAVHLLGHVDARPVLPDVAELILALERRILRHRQRLRLVDQLAVQETPARGHVDDGARLGRDLVERDAPFLGRRLAKHEARGRACLPERLQMIAHAAAPAVGLLAGDRVAVDLGVRGRRLDPDTVPLGVELVGDDHRHGRHRALPHLGHRVDDGDDAVAVDAEPLVRREDARSLGLGEDGVEERQPEAHDEPGADGDSALEQLAAADERAPGHHAPPRASVAARWTAARIRWYVPQRQMLPDMAASISASLGRGFSASSAVADMICPDWQ